MQFCFELEQTFQIIFFQLPAHSSPPGCTHLFTQQAFLEHLLWVPGAAWVLQRAISQLTMQEVEIGDPEKLNKGKYRSVKKEESIFFSPSYFCHTKQT